MKKRTVGLIVNPVAGMGGSVGLKGTDGEMHEKAVALGAEPVTPARTREMLAHLGREDEIAFVAAPGRMGAVYLEEMGIPATWSGRSARRPRRRTRSGSPGRWWIGAPSS